MTTATKQGLPERPQGVEKTPEYDEGDWAFHNFEDLDDCPYRSTSRDGASGAEGRKRSGWMAGWLDAKYKQKYPQYFDPDHEDYKEYPQTD